MSARVCCVLLLVIMTIGSIAAISYRQTSTTQICAKGDGCIVRKRDIWYDIAHKTINGTLYCCPYTYLLVYTSATKTSAAKCECLETA